jgi:hypothetical protein
VKRLPPYAKRATSNPDKGLIGFYIYTGRDAWNIARDAKCPALVLPDGERPECFRWPVAGHAVTVVRTSPLDTAVQLSLARELLRAGAEPVFATENGPLVHFTAEVKRAA